MSTIQARNFEVFLGDRALVSSLNFRCHRGEITGIIGPSGCGKTTLLNAMSGLFSHTRGELHIDGDDSTLWRPRRWRRFWRDQASFIHQNHGIIPDRDIAFNVSLSSRDDRTRVEKSLNAAALNISPTVRAGILSGGQQQRVGIARAMYKDAQFVFADEPTASLDRDNREHVVGLLRDLAQQGRTVIVATHDEELQAEANALITL